MTTDLGKKVIYQIYPKSFYDSDHDGIGDLRGIIEKIPYLAKLNIDMIWFNPFFVSPQNDNGYDIADYRQIDPRFGTMADFEELVAKLKEVKIDVMLDMVLNHCSTEHEWFQKALAGEEKYQKYFYLRPKKADGSLPTNWSSKFGGPAWSRFGETDLYYLHLYDKTQADLDWHNPEVRKEAAAIVNFWKAKGVKGFRFDVINVIGKANELVDSTDPVQEKRLYTDTPIVHQYLKELNQASFGQDETIITVGEMSSTNFASSIKYSDPAEHELSMVFTFHHLKVDYADGEKWSNVPFDLMTLKKCLTDWQVEMDQGGGWNALFWNNHDQPFALNRFGDTKKYRVRSAQMLAAALHLLRGTPYIYMGEEIGMVDPTYTKIKDYVDVEALNAYQALQEKGYSASAAFAIVKTKTRDNSRTPMHWDSSSQAGFSTTTPWLRPTGQEQINVKAELEHGTIFNFYQKLIQLRKNERLISDGHFKARFAKHQQVFAYERYLDDDSQKLLVFNNFSARFAELELPATDRFAGKTLVTNMGQTYEKLPQTLKLAPYETLAFKFDRPKL